MATETAVSPPREVAEPLQGSPRGNNENSTENDKATAEQPKKRPKLDLSMKQDRKRGKSMFGLVLGTLNKAKLEDKKRSATDAAKKRTLIDQRLQAKIAKEAEIVRKAEETKRDRQTANRKEEDLALKDSIQRSRFTRLTYLSNFLSTSDDVRTPESSPEPEMEEDVRDPDEERRVKKPKSDPLQMVSRSHPPPVFFLPAVLLPSQRSFIDRRKEAVKNAIEKERVVWLKERKAGIDEIVALREKVAEAEDRLRLEKAKEVADAEDQRSEGDQEEHMEVEDEKDDEEVETQKRNEGDQRDRSEKERSPTPISKSQAMDEDDAVEY